MATLTPEQTSHLLHWIVWRQVSDCVDHDRLRDFEQALANEIGRMPDVTDDQMLALMRGLIGRALRSIADGIEDGSPGDPDDDLRYVNAICREAVAECERDQRASVAG